MNNKDVLYLEILSLFFRAVTEYLTQQTGVVQEMINSLVVSIEVYKYE